MTAEKLRWSSRGLNSALEERGLIRLPKTKKGQAFRARFRSDTTESEEPTSVLHGRLGPPPSADLEGFDL